MPEFGSSVRKPVSVYHKELDRIEVRACRRCGIEKACDGCITEINGGTLLTLLEANYPKAGERLLAGFVIECAHIYCRQQGLLREGRVNLHEVLNSLLYEPCRHEESNVAVARTALRHLDTTSVQLS